MQATAHTCIWTVTHRPLPPVAVSCFPAASGSSRRPHHDSGTDLDLTDDNDQTPTATPAWIHPPTSVYTLGTHQHPTLPAPHHPNHAWLATSAALHSRPSAQADPLGNSTTRSALALLESMLLNHAARPLALHWLPTARNAGEASVHVPLDTGVLVRLSMRVNPWVPATHVTDVVLDATLAEAATGGTGGIKTVRDEYRNWTIATRRQVESVHEAAAKRVAANLPSARDKGAGSVPSRWGAAVVAPHFVACHLPAVGKVRVYFSVNRHKLVNVERRAMGTPTMVEVDVGKEVGGGGAGDVGAGKVRLETLGEHLAAVGERSVAMYQIREMSGVMQVNPTSTLSFGADTLRVAHLSWGSTLLTLIQSSTPTLDGNTELWIRGYAFNTKSRAWEELDAQGPVLSLPAADTGEVSAWTVGEPVLTGSSTGADAKSRTAEPGNRPASTRSKAARAHAMSVVLGTSTGKMMHIAVQFSSSSVSWSKVELTHPVTPLAPSGIAHLAMHPGGCFIAAVDTLGRVAVVDLVGKSVSVRHAFTSSSSTSSSAADPIHPLETLGFNAPPSLVSWAPPPRSPLNPPTPLPGQRTFVPTLPAPTLSTLLLVFDRGPFAALTFDFAPTSTSLIGYARHLLARGPPGWTHVHHHANHLPLHSPSDIATLGHMLLTSIPTTPADPMRESGAYHTHLQAIATRVLDTCPAHASATALARKLVHEHLAHGRLELALSAAASTSSACSDLMHLVALCASQQRDARGLAAAAHFQFLKTCPGPYPPLLAADPMPADQGGDGDGDGARPTVGELVDMYTRQVAPIAAGIKPAFGMDVRRLAAYLEVSGEREQALRWWRRVGYEDEGRRGWERVARVVGWWEGKRRGEGEGR